MTPANGLINLQDTPDKKEILLDKLKAKTKLKKELENILDKKI